MSEDFGASLVEYTIPSCAWPALVTSGSSTGDNVGISASRIVTAQGGTYP
jgi:hypothetical protein